MNFLDENSFSPLARESLIYLSPDASEILEVVDKKKVYIIGGIVDKTVKKNLSLSHAMREEIECYRLPIREHISVQGSLALSIDACVQILTSFAQKHDWRQAFEQHLPDRKKQDRSSQYQLLQKVAPLQVEQIAASTSLCEKTKQNS